MGIKVICFAVCFFVALNVDAAECEVCDEKQEVFVMINASKDDNNEILCHGNWNIAHLQTERGEPLRRAMDALIGQSVEGQPFTSKVLDDAVLGVMFGVEWKQVEMLSLSVRAGVKRYTLEVTYEGGDLAYPGKTSLYTDAFTRNKLLPSQKDVKRIMKGGVAAFFC